MGEHSAVITVIVNDEPRELPAGSDVHALIAALGLTPDRVAVEVNKKLVRARDYARPLEAGDRVEVVTFVGGG